MTGTLKDATNVTLLKGKDWDPTQRATNVANGQAAITAAEGLVSTTKQAYEAAIANRRAAIDNTYDLASASVGGVESALGKNHALTQSLRGLRGAMSHASSGSGDGDKPDATGVSADPGGGGGKKS